MAFLLQKVKGGQTIKELPISSISASPHQTRRYFDEAELDALAQSIDRNGLLNPISVRPQSEGGYCLIAGERRLRACQKLGWVAIPAILWEKDETTAAALTLAENMHRSNLNYLEEAAGILQLLAEGKMTQAEGAAMLAMSQPALCNKLRLLRLSPVVQQELLRCQLAERVARALLSLSDDDLQLRAIHHISTQAMNVRQAEEYIEELGSQQKKSRPYHGLLRDYRILFTTVDRAVEEIRKTGVSVSTQKREEEDCVSYTIRIPKTARKREISENQLSLYA